MNPKFYLKAQQILPTSLKLGGYSVRGLPLNNKRIFHCLGSKILVVESAFIWSQ